MSGQQPLTPGQIVTYPEHGVGLVGRAQDGSGDIVVMYNLEIDGESGLDETCDLTGWQPAEIVKPGHVQVRVDDLDLNDIDFGVDLSRRATTAWREWDDRQNTAQAESHTDSADVETVADSDAPKLTPGQRYRDCDGDVWVTLDNGRLAMECQDGPLGYGLTVRRVEEENGPLTLIDDEQPTTTTVSLPCPDCGQGITREVALLRAEGSTPPAWSITPRPAIAHRCQPDEPTDPGSKVTVNDQRFVLADDDAGDRWINIGNGDSWRWTNLCAQGTVTLGWGDGQ